MLRGILKPSLSSGVRIAPRCAAMAVGSLPYVDVEPALSLIVETTPEVPAWPQLPRRSFLENMYAQFAEGLPGLEIDVAGGTMVQHHNIPDEDLMIFAEALGSGDLTRFAISPESAAGLHALPDLLSRLPRPATLIKGQVTGPVSFCLQLTDEGRRPVLYDDTVRELVTEMLTARAIWQQRFLQEAAPDAAVLMMVDEPFLTQWGSGYLSMPDDLVVAPLEHMLGALDCLAGIHVCGGTDWSKVAALPVDLLNFDAADHSDALLAHAEAVAAFVADGGLLAWGVVPNDDRALSLAPQAAAATLLDGVRALAAVGAVGEDQILAQSYVTPACGTGALPVQTAEACLRLAASTSELVRATRM